MQLLRPSLSLLSFNERENYIALTQSTVGICLRDRLSIELTFHFLSRKICGKIPSYVNLSICLLHERENYIGRRLRDRRTIDELHFRNSMVSIELTKYYLMNYPILYAVVLSFSSSGGIVLKLGGNCPDIGGELSGANCPRGELSDISQRSSFVITAIVLKFKKSSCKMLGDVRESCQGRNSSHTWTAR